MNKRLMRFPFSSEVRNLYLRAFRHRYWEEHFSLPRQFYSRFVKPGSLVFDIGANVGEYTRCFLSLGARVVAVEPLPDAVNVLQRTLANKNRLFVVPSAAGADFSEAVLHVAGESTLCTLSDRWLRTAKESERFSGVTWTSEIKVPVIPISSLVSQYGEPDFIKIDVEGFEEQVLDGIKELPAALSFEFNTEASDAAIACLHKGCFSPATKFAFYIGEPRNEGLSRWMGRDEIVVEIQKLSCEQPNFGDIVAVRS